MGFACWRGGHDLLRSEDLCGDASFFSLFFSFGINVGGEDFSRDFATTYSTTNHYANPPLTALSV